MPPKARNYVVYLRVSTQKQGASGLGLEAQRAAVESYLTQHGGRVLSGDTFREIESGKHNDRPQLAAALKRCRQARATLLVAKLDRLSRDAAFLMNLKDAGVRFVAADIPDVNELTVGIMALIAQQEREAISARTKAALAAAKARGIRLGNPQLQAGTAESAAAASKANQQAAQRRAADLVEVIEQANADGHTTLRQQAARLNELGIPTPRGGAWHAASVRRLHGHIARHK
jgi:DNA invertase Pin-like site-specific DNA recombinase